MRYLAALLILLCAAGLNAEITLPGGDGGSVPVFGRYEMQFQVDRAYQNPYDPDEIAIDAVITGPGGEPLAMPCFWMVPVADGKRVADKATWALRFSPTRGGEHAVTVRLKDSAGRQEEAKTTFLASKALDLRGFLRADPWNPQFMRFDNGEPYYPLGMNVGAEKWPNVLNWRRYWLETFNDRGLEWTKGPGDWSDYEGLGRYSQVGAAKLDAELDLCEKTDRYMQIVFHYHEQVLDGTDLHHKFDGTPEWNDKGSPYWTGNGGPVEKAADWHSNLEAQKYQKRMYRYIVARWGYSPHILGWELFNETDYSSSVRAGKMKDVVDWHDQMSRYLKSIDPYRRIVLTSISNPYWGHMVEALEKCGGLDMIQNHLYADDLRDKQIPVADRFRKMRKPTWMAEFGMEKPERDATGRHIRRAYWLGMMNAQPAMYWFPYAQEERFLPVFKTLRDFMGHLDVAKETGGVPIRFDIQNQPLVDSEIRLTPTITNHGGEPRPNRFMVRRDGTVEDVDQLPRYVRGLENPGTNHELVFRTDFEAPCAFSAELVGGTQAAPIAIEMQLNSVPPTEVVLAGQATAPLQLPPGPQVITLRARQQGFELGAITLKTQRHPLVAIGYAGPRAAYGYIYDASLSDFSSEAGTEYFAPVISVPRLEKGSYDITFVHPTTGKTETRRLSSDDPRDHSIHQALPRFREDLAFRIQRIAD